MPDPAQSPTVIYDKASKRLRRLELRLLARRLSRELADGRPFTCLVADADALRRFNRDFRGKDETTDVISFPAGVPLGQTASQAPLGDVAISIEHARAQAAALGHSVEQEIGVLMLHGVLHLIGMDHETDRGQMRRAESRWRRELGLPLSLTERRGSSK